MNMVSLLPSFGGGGKCVVGGWVRAGGEELLEAHPP